MAAQELLPVAGEFRFSRGGDFCDFLGFVIGVQKWRGLLCNVVFVGKQMTNYGALLIIIA